MFLIRALAVLVLTLLVPVAAASAAPKADLAMKGVTAPAQAAAGGKIAASFEVRTSGSRAPKAATVAFRLSRDGRLDKADPALGRGTTVRALRKHKGARSTVTLTIPASTKPGAYRLFACVDPGGRVRERSERNNCSARPLKVVKRGPATPPGPLPGQGGGPAAAVAAAVAGAVESSGAGAPPKGEDPKPGPQDPGPQHPDHDPTAGQGAAPDPGTIAPPVSTGTSTSIADAVDFLYKGENAIQTGVDDGTISERRIAVLRGRVITRADQALAGVKVTVKDHPELGETKTQADGGFDMAVNGGGTLTLEFERDGYVTAQREVEVPWKDFVDLGEDVALVRFDAANTEIDPDSATPYQVHQATPSTDGDGTREATLLFEQGTDAQMVLPGGGEVPLDTMTVRATEFTSGENGEEAMPGDLPSTSGYTYAVEMSVDEAVAAGATEVEFSKPVINYTENFLGFPAGEAVPTGYFDREKGEWVPSKDGRVIKILSEGADADADGAPEAAVDTDGDGLADEGLGIDNAERERLAQLYAPGDSLWRVEMKHFTPWDHNWPYGPPEDAEWPQQEWQKKLPPEKESKCKFLGSIIDCESQRLGETLPLAGTTSKLAYWSDRVPGRGVERTLPIPLTGASVPASLKAVELRVTVAGVTHKERFGRAANNVYEFQWDGKDAYGRQLQGSHPATVEVGYVYGARYYPARRQFDMSFGRPGLTSASSASRSGREDIVLWTTWRDEIAGAIGVWDARAAGLGGWTLTDHHAYDAERRTVHLGNGERISIDPTISTIAGSTRANDGTPQGDGGQATAARLHNLRDVVEAPDGSVYFSEDYGSQAWVRRIAPDGTLSTVAGGGDGSVTNPEGKLATEVRFGYLSFALMPDGDLLVGDPGRLRVWRLDRETNRYTLFAGNGSSGLGSGNPRGVGDGGPATEASLPGVYDVAVGPDGSVYIIDFNHYSRVRRVMPNGIIETFAGTEEWPDPDNASDVGDGRPATEAILYDATEVLPAADGSVYIAHDRTFYDSRGGTVRRVAQDGTITTVAGGKRAAESLGDGHPATEQNLGSVEGIAIARDGSLLMTDEDRRLVRRVATDGILTTVAGGKPASPGNGDGGPGPAAHIPSPWDVAVTADGSVLVTEGWNGSRIRKIARPFPLSDDGEVTIPARDGGQLYVFDAEGRHVKTLDGTTQALVRRFEYDGEGRLAQMIDADGLETVVERSGGVATAIVAPGGQRTKLTVGTSGYLERVESPSAEVTQLTYGSGGLLTGQTDPRGGVHAYTHDAKGRLLTDTDPELGKQTLTRTQLNDGYRIALSTKLGRAQTTELRRLDDGSLRTEITDRDGSKNLVVAKPDGSQVTTYASGMVSEATRAPDPRWDYSVPLLASQVDKSPSGKTRTTTLKRVAELADQSDPMSLEKLTDTLTVNGKAHTTVYDHAARTLTRTSAGGRVERTTFDSVGRVTKSQPSGVDPIDYVHDGRGRIQSVTQGDQRWTFTYDAKDRVETRTNALNQVTRYGYDDSDRVTSITNPDQKVTRFEYAPGGDTKAIVMPDGERHVMTHDKRGKLKGFTPFGSSAALTKAYDGDGRTDATTLPGGAVLDNQYDDQHRPSGTVFPEAATSIGYKPGTGLPSSLSRTAAGTGTVDTTSFDFDGEMPTKTTIAPGGTTLATFDQTYGNDLLQASAKLTSGTTTVTSAITRNDDGLVTGYGPFTLARSGPGGAVSAITDTKLSATFGYDGAGVPDKRSTTVNGQHAFGVDVTYDAGGRVATRVEKAGATERTFTYVHDASGRLTEVKRDGVVVEQYGYDDNGNRTSRKIGDAAVEIAAYDDQDRLATRDGRTYEFSAAGHMVRRGSDTFDYSARGELLSATVGQTTVEYRYDGMGRRVARIQGNDTTRYLYGNPNDPFEVTGVRSPSGTVTRYFYDEQGLLFAMQRGASRFYIATDQVGTPRAVTDVNGAVVKRLELDAFGAPVSDSAPAFDLPFGFAGGLADPVTGLVRFGMRDYEPLSGRWTARDPALFDGGQTNLYSYVGNAPVAYRDPTGLFCIGGSVYGGFGGGASFCMNSEGDFSVCVEAGLGVGTDVDIDWAGDVAKDGESIIAEVKAKAGPIGIKFGGELDNTGCITGGPEVELGSVKITPDGVAYKTPIELETSGGPAFVSKAAKLGVSAKVAAKFCRASKVL